MSQSDAFGELDSDFGMSGQGMPKGNKRAGYVGLLLAKHHLRRGPNDYDPQAKRKKTAPRFNIGAMQTAPVGPSNYIKQIYGRQRRGAVSQGVGADAQANRPLTAAQRQALRQQAEQGNQQAVAQLQAIRQAEAERQRRSRAARRQRQGGAMTGGGFWSDFGDGFKKGFTGVMGVAKPLIGLMGPEGKVASTLMSAVGLGRGGAKPNEKDFFNAVKHSYDPQPPISFGTFKLFYNTPTIDGYVDETRNTIIIAVRGTKPSDFQDVKADASIVANRLAKSDRYMGDKQQLQTIFQRYDPQKYEYYLTGHSLGGAIINQLKRDFPFLKDAVQYNPAFQPYDLIRQQHNQIKRNYTADDPLYALGGRFFQNQQVVPTTRTKVPTTLGTLGTMYNAYQGHALDNFAPLYGGAKPIKKLMTMDGKVHKGAYHICSDGQVHSGKTHTKRSKPLQVV
jgi:hypothetical protein